MYAANMYRSNEAATASKGALLVMLYDGIGKFLRQASATFRAEDVAEGRYAIGRALDIIGYLQATLDEEASEEVVEALDKMYLAWTLVLVQASTKVQVDKVDAINDQVDAMRATWATAKHRSEGGR